MKDQLPATPAAPAHRALASIDEWRSFAAAHPQLTALDAFIIDVNGNAVGKRLAIADAHPAFTDGVLFSSCALFADVRGLGHNVQGMGGSDGDPDGTAQPASGNWFSFLSHSQIPPGSTIVVPRNPDPLDTLTLITDLTDIVSKVALTAASLAVIGK